MNIVPIPEVGDLLVHGVCEDDSEGHALLRLVSGVAEHQALRGEVNMVSSILCFTSPQNEGLGLLG